MTATAELKRYADAQIERLDLGDGGPLGTEFVVCYDDGAPGQVRIDDGQHADLCHTRREILKSLQGWRDWITEGVIDLSE